MPKQSDGLTPLIQHANCLKSTKPTMPNTIWQQPLALNCTRRKIKCDVIAKPGTEHHQKLMAVSRKDIKYYTYSSAMQNGTREWASAHRLTLRAIRIRQRRHNQNS